MSPNYKPPQRNTMPSSYSLVVLAFEVLVWMLPEDAVAHGPGPTSTFDVVVMSLFIYVLPAAMVGAALYFLLRPSPGSETLGLAQSGGDEKPIALERPESDTTSTPAAVEPEQTSGSEKSTLTEMRGALPGRLMGAALLGVVAAPLIVQALGISGTEWGAWVGLMWVVSGVVGLLGVILGATRQGPTAERAGWIVLFGIGFGLITMLGLSNIGK